MYPCRNVFSCTTGTLRRLSFPQTGLDPDPIGLRDQGGLTGPKS